MTDGEKLGIIHSLGDRIIRVLPPAFLLLLILNIVFMGSVIYVVQHNADYRNVLLTKIIDKCLLDQPK
jgi:hypothetical protein